MFRLLLVFALGYAAYRFLRRPELAEPVVLLPPPRRRRASVARKPA